MMLILMPALAQANPVISHDPLSSGAFTTLAVDGALPGETVVLLSGLAAAPGPCPPLLGGVCLDVRSPRVLGTAVADGTGRAELAYFVAAGSGTTVYLQAAIRRGVGGSASVVSPVVSAVVDDVDADGDGHLASADCDDADPDVHPGAVERCNDIDDDCDPTTSEDGLVTVGGVNYTSVGDALNFAAPGADVYVCAGTWNEALRVTRDSSIIGVAGPEHTVIDATGTGLPTLDLAGGTFHTIEGVTLTGGDSGLVLGHGADVVVRHAVITENHASWVGGGVRDDSYYWTPSNLTMEDVEISWNTAAREGGGLRLDNGVNTLTDVRVLFNEAGGVGGGGLFLDDHVTETTLTGCTFHGNVAGVGTYGGGGVYLQLSTGPLTVVDSDFGVGATENTPTDVTLMSNLPTPPVDYTWFGAGESFVCDTTARTCL